MPQALSTQAASAANSISTVGCVNPANQPARSSIGGGVWTRDIGEGVMVVA
jgi:hypothetical protein